eukprot:gene7655-9417_t
MEEMKVYFTDPDFLQDTLFLKFLFSQLTTIPLLTSKDQAKVRFQQLIHTLPSIVIQSQIATKQETTDHFRKFVVKCFDVALRTPLEKKKDKTLRVFYDPSLEDDKKRQKKGTKQNHQRTLEDEENDNIEEERKKNPKDIERDETIEKLQRRLTEITQVIIMNIESRNKESGDNSNGIGYLFNVILTTPRFQDLPAEFFEFTSTVIKIMALWMEREMRDPKQVKKIKRLYMVTPVKAIRASLAIANPITLLKGIILLFLAKPFGSRNLIQTITSVIVESGKTDKTTKKAYQTAEQDLQCFKPNIRKLLLQKMKNFVYNMNQIQGPDGKVIPYFKDMPDAIAILQYQWPGSPPVDPDVISQLGEEHFKSLFEYVKLEKRKKEKNDFVEILGNDEMIEIIRELLPVLYEPLGKLFCKANIGYHFEKLAYVIKKLVIAAETGELEEDDDDLELQEDPDDDDTTSNKSSPNLTPVSSPTNSNSSTDQPVLSPTPKKNLFSRSFDWIKTSSNNIFSSTNSNNNSNNNKSPTSTPETSNHSPTTQPETSNHHHHHHNIVIGSNKVHNDEQVPIIKVNQENGSPNSNPPQQPSPRSTTSSPRSLSPNNTTTTTTTTTTSTTSKTTDSVNEFINNVDQQQQQEQQKAVKKKFKKDKKQSITMSERLLLFEDVNTLLMERLYAMVHELVVSDAKTNGGENSEMKTGLLSQSVCWLLGLLQFLKDEEIDVQKEIFNPLSPSLKQKIVQELDTVIKYREWRLEHGNMEATKENIEKIENENLSVEELKQKTKEERPDKPVLEYIPTLTGPFISLMTERLKRLGDPSKYSLTNLSKVIGSANDVDLEDDFVLSGDDTNNNNILQPGITTTHQSGSPTSIGYSQL